MDLFILCKTAVASALRGALARDPIGSLRTKGNLKSFQQDIVRDLREHGYAPTVDVTFQGTPTVTVTLSGSNGNYTAALTAEDLSEALGFPQTRRPDVRDHRMETF